MVSRHRGVAQQPLDQPLPEGQRLDAVGRIDDEHLVFLQGGHIFPDELVVILQIMADDRPVFLDLLLLDFAE